MRDFGPDLGRYPPSRSGENKLTKTERRGVLDVLCSDRFVDQVPLEVHAQLIDDGVNLCSMSMYRIRRGRMRRSKTGGAKPVIPPVLVRNSWRPRRGRHRTNPPANAGTDTSAAKGARKVSLYATAEHLVTYCRPVLGVMLFRTTARGVIRAGYRLVRLPWHCIDTQVLPTFLDERSPVKLAYERLLIGCDRIAATVLDDESAAAHALRIDQRSTIIRYGIARHQRQIQRETDAVLTGASSPVPSLPAPTRDTQG